MIRSELKCLIGDKVLSSQKWGSAVCRIRPQDRDFMSGLGNNPAETNCVGFSPGSRTEPNRTAVQNLDPFPTVSITNKDRILNLLERVIYCVTPNEWMLFRKEFSICLIEFNTWWEMFCVQKLQKIIQQCIIHFRYPKRHRVHHMSDFIWQLPSGDYFMTDISEQLHISNVNKV